MSKSIYAARRAYVQTACDKIAAGQQLDDADRQCTWGILSMILRGDDALEYLGIEPKRRASDAAQQKQLSQLWIAVHYGMLREDEDMDAPALREVALKWGISDESVYRIARRNPAGAMRTVKALSRNHLLKIIEEESAHYRRNFTKSRIE
jgi:hypothetical protein